MKTTLYLLRHAATAANLARPARLQGLRHDPPLCPLGVRQAEATRDLLAVRPIDWCYCSPMARAVETAAAVAGPHGLTPTPLEALRECDVGRWEGLDWETIRRDDRDAHDRYMADPSVDGYPGGETFGDVARRAGPAIDELLDRHAGESVLVVAHHVVNRVYLACALGLGAGRGRQISLDNCGVSVIVRSGGTTSVAMLNATFHLQGLTSEGPRLRAAA